MKNQNDLIVAGAVVLVAIGVSLGFMFTKREPAAAPAVPSVVVSEPQPTAASVAYSDSLPGAGGARGGRGGRAGFGGGGGSNDASFAGAGGGGGSAFGRR
ncbi:MAG: hypothetical protein IH945_04705 [Armatimonadetes bacterium]|nr:hypothetical protein [Armatimonadota bacterium]